MAHRQEEKEQRKRERLERERAAEAAAKRKRLLQIGGGVVVAAVVAAGVVLAVAGGESDTSKSVNDAALKRAAAAAGCVYRSFPDEGQAHLASQTATFDDYKTNPPTSGTHRPPPAAPDGLYPPGNEPDPENWVHTLEHGRVVLMYKPGASPQTVAALQRLFAEPVLDSGKSYHMALMRNNTKMPFEGAAVAWRHYVACKDVGPEQIATMRKFRDRFIDKGPEFVP
jgi:hypothetical protein